MFIFEHQMQLSAMQYWAALEDKFPPKLMMTTMTMMTMTIMMMTMTTTMMIAIKSN